MAALRKAETPEAGRAAAEWGVEQGVLRVTDSDQRMLACLMLGLQDNANAVEGAPRLDVRVHLSPDVLHAQRRV